MVVVPLTIDVVETSHSSRCFDTAHATESLSVTYIANTWIVCTEESIYVHIQIYIDVVPCKSISLQCDPDDVFVA